MKLLFYPQFTLAFWGPLIVLGLWQLLRRRHTRCTGSTRFWLAWSVSMFPLLALFVPYLPHSPLRDLPYRVPVAWGVFNSPDITTAPFWYALVVDVPFFSHLRGLAVRGGCRRGGGTRGLVAGGSSAPNARGPNSCPSRRG